MLAAVVLATGTGSISAAIIGPDSYGYRATNKVPYAWVDLTSTGTRVLVGQDDTPITVPIGFTFKIYGNDYSRLSFNPNGLISFAAQTNRFTNVDLTANLGSLLGLPWICVLNDDWKFVQPGSDGAYYRTEGSPGHRRFEVEWNVTYGYPRSPSSVTFEAVLNEGSNNILLQFADVDSGDFRSKGGSATVGIKDNPAHGAGR
jgi:hypothetical protein